jgi:hypothetical protein
MHTESAASHSLYFPKVASWQRFSGGSRELIADGVKISAMSALMDIRRLFDRPRTGGEPSLCGISRPRA